MVSLVRLMLYLPFALMHSCLMFRHYGRYASMAFSTTEICPTLRLSCGTHDLRQMSRQLQPVVMFHVTDLPLNII
jgi:hypothetical protein